MWLQLQQEDQWPSRTAPWKMSVVSAFFEVLWLCGCGGTRYTYAAMHEVYRSQKESNLQPITF